MTPEVVVQIFRDAFTIVIMITAVIATPGLIVGLIVAVFQAATSINEQTLSFLPRLLVTIGTLMFVGHWLINVLMEYFINLVNDIPNLVG